MTKNEKIALELLAALHAQTMDDNLLPSQSKECADIISRKVEEMEDWEGVEVIIHALVIEVLSAQELRRRLSAHGN